MHKYMLLPRFGVYAYVGEMISVVVSVNPILFREITERYDINGAKVIGGDGVNSPQRIRRWRRTCFTNLLSDGGPDAWRSEVDDGLC